MLLLLEEFLLFELLLLEEEFGFFGSGETEEREESSQFARAFAIESFTREEREKEPDSRLLVLPSNKLNLTPLLNRPKLTLPSRFPSVPRPLHKARIQTQVMPDRVHPASRVPLVVRIRDCDPFVDRVEGESLLRMSEDGLTDEGSVGVGGFSFGSNAWRDSLRRRFGDVVIA